MGEAARRLARPHAARALADELVALAERWPARRPRPPDGATTERAQLADRLELLDQLAAERGIRLDERRGARPAHHAARRRRRRPAGGGPHGGRAGRGARDGARRRRAGRRAGQGQRRRGGRCRRARPRDPQPGRRDRRGWSAGARGVRRGDGHPGQALHRHRAGRHRVRDQHPRQRRGSGVGQRRGARRRDARHRRQRRGLELGGRRGNPAERGLRVRVSRLALQGERRDRARGVPSSWPPAMPARSRRGSPPTRRSARRRSRSPIRTRAASFAIRPTTMRAG